FTRFIAEKHLSHSAVLIGRTNAIEASFDRQGYIAATVHPEVASSLRTICIDSCLYLSESA
ncbi:MAG: hypothetical protein MJE68_14960, partial [Proteobacteria bacterium]|nr:hypothetical protein [Pseudomonadota bacterium]